MYILSFSAWVLYISIVGVSLRGVSVIKSSRIITKVTPAGAKFFWAPANKSPNLLTSKGSLKTQEEISATKGMFPVSGRYS